LPITRVALDTPYLFDQRIMKKSFFPLLLFTTFAVQAAVSPEVMENISAPNLAKRYEAEITLRAIAFQAGAPGADAAVRSELQKELLAVASDSNKPEPARLSALAQMPYLADGAAVPALSALLQDPLPAIREGARCALRNNPDPAASASLRSALEKATDPTWELGLMEALIHRGDNQAAPLFVKKLTSTNHVIASLAAQGLGSIGNASSLETLRSYSENCPPAILSVAQSALIRCAERLGGNAARDSVASIWPKAANAAVRSEIFQCLLANNQTQAVEILREAIANPDLPGANEIFRIAILSGKPTLSDEITTTLPRLPTDARLAVHAALADLNDSSQEEDLHALTKALDGKLKSVAINLLARSGTEKTLDFLANDSSPDAAFVINQLKIEGLDQKLLDASVNTTGEEQKKTVRLLAARNPIGTEALLLKLAAPEVTLETRSAALAGLQTVGSLDSAKQIVEWVATAQPGADVKPYQALFRRIAPRMNASIFLWEEVFVPAYAKAGEENKRALIPMIPGMSGPASSRVLVDWIQTGQGDRDELVKQLVAWQALENGPFLLQAAVLPELDEQTRTKVYFAATRLLYPNVRGHEKHKVELAANLLASAPEGPMRELVETSIKEAEIKLPQPQS
jgi:hypothetical protein